MGCFEYISCILKEFWDNCKYFKRYEVKMVSNFLIMVF